MFPLLTLLIFLPMVGVCLLLMIRGKKHIAERNARHLGLLISWLTCFVAIFLWTQLDFTSNQIQLLEHASLGYFSYRVGVDALSACLILLTATLFPLTLMLLKGTIKKNIHVAMITFLALETMLLGAFCSMDTVLFYIFFEGSLIPMYFIIGLWGGKERIQATYTFFLYTLLGSLLMLLGIIFIAVHYKSTSLIHLLTTSFSPKHQYWLWLCFFASFAVKLPMWPFHTWLPKAHVQAPTPGSMILAGVLLKLGAYGFLRFSLPLFPDASALFSPMMLALSGISVIVASLLAFSQKDMKAMIAYSSIAHMGYITAGIFAFSSSLTLVGAGFQMLSHGWISAALFLCVSILAKRLHSREIDSGGGIATALPFFSVLTGLFIMANLGLPGLSGFVGEILIIVGIIPRSLLMAGVLSLGIILSALYCLTFYKKIFFGKIPQQHALQALTFEENFVLIVLGLATLLAGLFPQLLLDILSVAMEPLTKLL